MKHAMVITFTLIILSNMMSFTQKSNPEYSNLIQKVWKLSAEKDFVSSSKHY